MAASVRLALAHGIAVTPMTWKNVRQRDPIRGDAFDRIKIRLGGRPIVEAMAQRLQCKASGSTNGGIHGDEVGLVRTQVVALRYFGGIRRRS